MGQRPSTDGTFDLLLDLPGSVLARVMELAGWPPAARQSCRTLRLLHDQHVHSLEVEFPDPKSKCSSRMNADVARLLKKLRAAQDARRPPAPGEGPSSSMAIEPAPRRGSLRRVFFDSYPGRALRFLSACPHLEALEMQSASDLRDVGALALVPGLTSLRLMDCVKLRDVRALSSLVRLTSLSLAGCEKVRDISAISSLAALRDLDLDGCVAVEDLGPLSSCTALAKLSLEGCEGIHDLSPLSACRALETLCLAGTRTESLDPLASCTALRSLDLRYLEGVQGDGDSTDNDSDDDDDSEEEGNVRLLALAACTRLTQLELNHDAEVRADDARVLQGALRGLTVWWQ